MNRWKGFWIVGGLALVAAFLIFVVLRPTSGQERPAKIVECANTADAHPGPKDAWQPAEVDMNIRNQLRHIRVDDVLQTGLFCHVAATYDGQIMRLYLDGAQVGRLAASGTVGAGVAVELSSDVEPLHGLLDEAGIYNRALSAEEIQAIYDAGNSGKCKP
jgi:C4-dicarboxylate-specific signal transduction histidine kinase